MITSPRRATVVAVCTLAGLLIDLWVESTRGVFVGLIIGFILAALLPAKKGPCSPR